MTSNTNTRHLGPPRSAPSYFCALFDTAVVIQQVFALYDPRPAMHQLGILDMASQHMICESVTALSAVPRFGEVDERF
jgi:hypothetical protein